MRELWFSQVEQQDSSGLLGPVRRFGRYALIKKLATGGMAEIWLARQRGLAGFQRFLVIKKILPHLSEQQTFVDMFLDEARTSAALTHPNIVQIYDLGREGDTYFIAMEYIAGEDLAALAQRSVLSGQNLSFGLSARIIADTSRALHYAHRLVGADGRPLDIVHRDVSPQNVLVTYEGCVKVVDFGIAKAATKSEQTRTGMLKGKFSYMSPEQCLGAPVDARSDVFALGILLYELTTGRRLFKHESELMILDMITRQPVQSPRDLVPAIPPRLERIILRALEKSPSDRHPTAQALQADLEAFLSASEPCTHEDLSRHIRSLFSDRIEEKRWIQEAASRDDLDDVFPPKEQEPQSTSPSPEFAPSIHPFLGPSAHRDGSLDDTRPAAKTAPARRWKERWPAVVSSLVIGVALVGLAALVRLSSWSEKRMSPGRVGVIVGSVPDGATIYVDGVPLRHPDGGFAKTPSRVSALEIGRTYHLELKREGYRTAEHDLVMTSENEGGTILHRLVPETARLTIHVEAPDPNAVEVLADGLPLGRGPRIIHSVEDAGPVQLSVRSAEERCTVLPNPISLQPGRTAEAAVKCIPDPKRSGAPKAPRAGTERREAPRRRGLRTRSMPPSASPSAQPGPKVMRRAQAAVPCAPNPALPQGYLTITTEPHSEIFLDGRRLGETPLSRIQVPSGCLQLEARTDGARKRFKIVIEPNIVSAYRVPL
ncbi:MAG: protein kinase [Myxococcota bacterium]